MKYSDEPNYTRVVLSGTEGKGHFSAAVDQAQCNHMLVSYLYASNMGSKWFEDRLDLMGANGSYMLDSGGHTFRSDGYCPKFPDLAWFEDYVLRYADFIREHADVIDLVVNLDLDNVVGQDKVDQWDTEVFETLEREGIQVCYVWHEEQGFEAWQDMCRKHRNVGLPGHLQEAEFHRYLRVAMMNGCRVHGFAATKRFILGRMPFASCDSITWKSGEMYGQTFIWENNKLKVMDKSQKAERIKYKAKWVAAGIDWELLENDKGTEITKACALAWGEYIRFVEQQSKKLAYWVKPKRFIQKHIPDISTAPLEDIKALYEQEGFSFEASGVDRARADLEEILAFVDRDTGVVFNLSDEKIDWWVAELGITPENDTRPEKEAAIRQELFKYFYKIAPDKELSRITEESMHPLYELAERQEELEDAPTVGLPLPVVSATSSAGILFGSEDENNQNGTLLTDQSDTSNEGSEHTESDPIGLLQDSIDKQLTDHVSDRTLRVKSMLLVELLFSQLKLKAQSAELKLRKKQVRKQRALRSEAAKLGQEITDTSEPLSEELHDKCIAMANGLLEAWKNIGELAGSLPPTKTKRGSNLTPAKASEIGKKGGAPLGNQNARKHGLTSKRMPNLACDHCPHVQVCPQYKEGHTCAYTEEFHAPILLEGEETPQIAAVKLILEKQLERARRGLLFETLEGGIANKSVDKIMDSVVNAAALLERMTAPKPPTGPIINNIIPNGSPAPAGGVLSSLFGSLKEASTVPSTEGTSDDPNTEQGS